MTKINKHDTVFEMPGDPDPGDFATAKLHNEVVHETLEIMFKKATVYEKRKAFGFLLSVQCNMMANLLGIIKIKPDSIDSFLVTEINPVVKRIFLKASELNRNEKKV